jgi:uncharacterized membrane protein
MSRLNLNLPFLYTYSTRIKTFRALLAYLALEVLPLVLAAGVTSTRNVINILLLYILWLALYEIGYLFNDLKDKNAVGEFDRIKSASGNWYIATLPRLLLAVGLVPVVVIRLGLHSTIVSLVANMLLLLTLLIHSSEFVRLHFPGRVVTFSALALYKYAPILIPVLGVARGASALVAIFFFYGFARILAYVLRKFSGEKVISARNPRLTIQLGALAVFSPLVLIAEGTQNEIVRGEVPKLWLYFSAVALISYGASLIRRRGSLGLTRMTKKGPSSAVVSHSSQDQA